MGLYTSYNSSEYYDTPEVKQTEVKKLQTEVKKVPLPPKVKKSLYEQAKITAETKSKYNGIDFRTKYRVGQKVAIQGPNGIFRTKNGVIAEIVAENLMYVYMEDTYKDATEQYLADFVTDVDTIHTI